MSSLLSFNLFKINFLHKIIKTQIRQLNLQEYQSKELLRSNGCQVQKFFICDKNIHWDYLDAFDQNDANFGWKGGYVVKAQILAGGRGKGHFIGDASWRVKGISGVNDVRGGVYITDNFIFARMSTIDMMTHRLVTNQTGPEGVEISKVMIAQSVDIKHEAYFSILMDPASNGPLIVACPVGGVDIEKVAESEPEKILKVPIHIDEGLTWEKCEKIAKWLGFNDKSLSYAIKEIFNLYNLFVKVDATQVEINPIAQIDDYRVFCIDAKLSFDDNAAFRQEKIFSLDNDEEMSQKEILAKKYGLSYIPMNGNIACMVNGAGLAMATMDIIKLNGGVPANFLDVGGSATVDQVCNAFKIVAENDPKIKAIFVNIFAGILRCDIVAKGIIAACNELKSEIPVVVRLKGTNVDLAKEMFKNASQLNGKFEFIESFEEAAKRVVELGERHVEENEATINNNKKEEGKEDKSLGFGFD